NNLHLELFFDAVEDAAIHPIAKTAVNTVPVAELFRQGSPFTSIFSDGVQGLKKQKRVNLNIAALFGQQVLDTVNMCLSPFHNAYYNDCDNIMQD
ncbi:MAG: hypothetical protein FWG73_08650, partial [Planctomycetaceae bacterium]|nr:hypothetical protein [Planctomycetaceae bacterium]